MKFVAVIHKKMYAMEKDHVNSSDILRVNINDVEVSEVTKTIYDYSNREDEITALVESIGSIGQQQPITVIKKDEKYLVLDGVLRLEALHSFKIGRQSRSSLLSSRKPMNSLCLT